MTKRYYVSRNDTKMIACTLCSGGPDDERFSRCCGAERDSVTGICSHCHKISKPFRCPDCDGSGEVPIDSD